MSRPPPAPASRHAAVTPRLSLKWKAFGLLLLLLSVIHVALGIRSYRGLVAQSERQLQARMAAYPAVLDGLLADEAETRAQIVGVLAATARVEDLARAESADLFLGSQLLADNLSVDFFSHDGERLGGWNSREPGLPSAALQAAIAELARSHRPVFRVVCGRECQQVVFVPTFDRGGREIVVSLAAPLNETLLSLERLGGVDVALLAPADDLRRPAIGRLAGRDLLAVTNAPTLLPTLQRLSPQLDATTAPGELWHASDLHSELLILRAPLAGSDAAGAAVLFIADQTATVRQIAAEFRRSALVTASGLTLSGIALYLLLAPATRRLTRLSGALPLLAERRFDDARRAMGKAGNVRLPDEIDVLRQTAHQLTDRLQALDAAEAASEAKSRFLAAMSHEIRTPMNGVMGMLELLEQSPLNSRQQQDVHVAHASAQALLRVIDDILDFSKIEAGMLTIEQVPFPLAEALENAVAALAPALRDRPIRLLSYVDPEIPAELRGDALRVRQVLLNLAGNALKFTQQGSVLVRADRIAASAGEIGVRFEVRDTGIGIAPAAQQELFKPFFQAEASITRRYGGSGLGLSICRGLVERMGGTLGLNSEPGRGSCFWFQLAFAAVLPSAEAAERPLAGLRVDCQLADRAEAALVTAYLRAAGAGYGPDATQLRVSDADAAPEAAGRAGLRIAGASSQRLPRPYRRAELIQALAAAAGRAVPVAASAPAVVADIPPPASARVLVAEDHPVNQRVIRSQLDKLGYAADIVGDGEEALRRLAGGRYAALITDLQMPGLNGYQLTARQREREAQDTSLGHLPIIALTANALQGEAQRCLAAGMDDYLSKPLLLRDLQARLQRWLSAAVVVETSAAAEPVDLALLRECLGDDPAAIQGLLGEFLRINAPLVEQLQELICRGSAAQTQALAHRLLGSARTVGALHLAEMLDRVEAAARSGATREASSALGEAVVGEFARVREWTAQLPAAGGQAAPE